MGWRKQQKYYTKNTRGFLSWFVWYHTTNSSALPRIFKQSTKRTRDDGSSHLSSHSYFQFRLELQLISIIDSFVNYLLNKSFGPYKTVLHNFVQGDSFCLSNRPKLKYPIPYWMWHRKAGIHYNREAKNRECLTVLFEKLLQWPMNRENCSFQLETKLISEVLFLECDRKECWRTTSLTLQLHLIRMFFCQLHNNRYTFNWKCASLKRSLESLVVRQGSYL